MANYQTPMELSLINQAHLQYLHAARNQYGGPGQVQCLDPYHGLRGTGGSPSQGKEIKVLTISQRGIFRHDATTNHEAGSGPHPKQPDLAPTLPRFIGLDYSRQAVPVWMLVTQGKILCNHALPDAASLIEEAVRRFGSVQGATLEACAGAVSEWGQLRSAIDAGGRRHSPDFVRKGDDEPEAERVRLPPPDGTEGLRTSFSRNGSAGYCGTIIFRRKESSRRAGLSRAVAYSGRRFRGISFGHATFLILTGLMSVARAQDRW